MPILELLEKTRTYFLSDSFKYGNKVLSNWRLKITVWSFTSVKSVPTGMSSQQEYTVESREMKELMGAK